MNPTKVATKTAKKPAAKKPAAKPAAKKSAAAKKPAAKKAPAKKRASAKPSVRDLIENSSARRPSWQGSVSFGLIHFPVQLFGVTTNRRIAFNQLRESDGSRIKQKRVAAADGEEVPFDKIIKGFEIEPGNFVTVEKDEMAGLAPERSRTLELEKFIDAGQIDPMFYDASYFVLPGKDAATPYGLLRDAMAAENRAAVARLVMHGKEHLVSLWPRGDYLVVSTMHFTEEITDPDELPRNNASSPGKKTAKKAELDAARALVVALSDDFDVTDYKDEHREALIQLIDDKARGKKITTPKTAPQVRETGGDLMAALEESLASVSSGTSKHTRRRGSAGTSHRKTTRKH
jgi:DNA end-binding protein Ku